MNASEYLKPAGTVVFVVALGVGYYLFEHCGIAPRRRKRRARRSSS
ncbi:hypothetical protein ACVWZR_003355 [Bradyrhizobium sp. i1.3.1]